MSFERTIARRMAIAATILLVAFIHAGAPAVSAADETHVRISGPRADWHPRPRWLIEINGKEWVISGSRAIVAETSLPAEVVIRALGDCRALFSFTARDRGPGGGYQVWYRSSGRFEVEATSGFNEGPYGLPSPGNRCPDLPDTATVAAGALETQPGPAIRTILEHVWSVLGRLF